MRSAAISRHQQSSLANSECVVIRFVTSKFRMFGHQVRHEQTPNVWSSGSSRANSECVVIRCTRRCHSPPSERGTACRQSTLRTVARAAAPARPEEMR